MSENIEVKLEIIERILKDKDILSCVAGSNFFFKEVSDSWINILGYSREELLSKPYLEFVHKDDREITENVAKGLIFQNAVQFKNRYISKDGKIALLEWKATTYNYNK